MYVHGYIRMNKDLPMAIREFALSTASVADSFGKRCKSNNCVLFFYLIHFFGTTRIYKYEYNVQQCLFDPLSLSFI